MADVTGTYIVQLIVNDGEFDSIGDLVTITVSEAPDPSEELPGVVYEYYQGGWGALPDFDTLTPVATGTVDHFDLSPRLNNSNFGFRFSGQIRITDAGSYTFYTSSDDGSQFVHQWDFSGR